MIFHGAFSNPLTSTAVLMVGGGAAYGIVRSLPRLIANLWNHFILCVEIDNSDSCFEWVKAWIGAHSKSTHLVAGLMASLDPDVKDHRRDRPRFVLWPRGIALVKFRGRRILTFTRRDDDAKSMYRRETIVLRSMRADRKIIEAMLAEAYDFVRNLVGECVEVWIPDPYGNWQLNDRKCRRRIESLSLPDGVHERLFEDARNFLARRSWYVQRGIPFRRGYLLYGPPGNGKSSMAHVLASELRTNVNIANLATFADDSQLMACLGKVPRGHILLLEDVDSIFKGREGQGAVKITFSALLNAIDGVCAQEGRILIMTTNHRERLDAALLRSGRADVQIELENPALPQIVHAFGRFYPEASATQARIFAGSCTGLSMAEVQEKLINAGDWIDNQSDEADEANLLTQEAAA